MRKISSYLYPNRVELLADLAGFTTEYTNVYQRTVKIYKGVDNVIEFDIKNADQKRIELNTDPSITDIMLNVMDSQGNALPDSPYTVTPYSLETASGTSAVVSGTADKTTTTTIVIQRSNATNTFKKGFTVSGTNIVDVVTITDVIEDIDTQTITLTVSFRPQTVSAHTVSITANSNPLKGIATTTIPAASLDGIDHQFLRYSVTATKGGNTIPLYADSRFGAVGTIEVVGTAMPTTRPSRTYNSFVAEIDLNGVPTYHSSAIPCKFYEAVPTETLSFDITVSGFVGSIWIEATKQSTITHESFKEGTFVPVHTYYANEPSGESETIPTIVANIGNYNYFRVSYSTPTINGLGASFMVTTHPGGAYTVSRRAGGTGYAIGSQIRVSGDQLGGVRDINDLVITVTEIGLSGGLLSSYQLGEIQTFSVTGTGGTRAGTYIVSGTNITGTVDNIVVS